jgi:signal transduction histidine kinase
VRLPIRARIACFGAVVVCATVTVFGLALYALAWWGGLRTVDQDLLAGSPATTFQAQSGADGRLRTLRQGGGGPVPERLPTPVRPGFQTLATGQDRVRLYVAAPAADGTFAVSGEHLGPVEAVSRSLLTYLLVTAVAAMLAGVAATWLAAGRALRPLQAIAAVAQEVGRTSDLRRRLPARRTSGDEVGRLTAAFNEMLGRLERAYESQRRFVADASHELRTPLTSIRGNAGLLARDPPPAVADARDAAADIAAESERMSRLVEDLLTLARADAGQRPRLAPLDLAAVVEPVARRAGLAAWLEPAPVVGDADALAQVAWILADNARRHAGGGAVWVRRRPGGGAALVVADEGPGIPPGEEERIFERFRQAGRSRSSGGTGLGLAIARGIVEQHGGRLWAANRPEGGALFVAEL